MSLDPDVVPRLDMRSGVGDLEVAVTAPLAPLVGVAARRDSCSVTLYAPSRLMYVRNARA